MNLEEYMKRYCEYERECKKEGKTPLSYGYAVLHGIINESAGPKPERTKCQNKKNKPIKYRAFREDGTLYGEYTGLTDAQSMLHKGRKSLMEAIESGQSVNCGGVMLVIKEVDQSKDGQ